MCLVPEFFTGRVGASGDSSFMTTDAPTDRTEDLQQKLAVALDKLDSARAQNDKLWEKVGFCAYFLFF